jgi:hypothetical protein
VIAATLIAEIGDARFRYAANDHLRAAFTWWAYNSIRLSPWARASYDMARSMAAT